MILSACATAPNGSPAPIRTGGSSGPASIPSQTTETNTETDGASGTETAEAPDELTEDGQDTVVPTEATTEAGTVGPDGGFVPPHMVGRDVKRAAVLLPFSHPNQNVRADAESLLAGIELALFNRNAENFVILPKDTAGVQSTARLKTTEALNEGADIIIGPLFSANIGVAREQARLANVPVVGFSSRPDAIGGGAYSIALSPEAEVTYVVGAAARRGAKYYAFLGGGDAYGRRAEQALRLAVARNGGNMIASVFYSPDNNAPVAEAEQIAQAINALGERPEGEIAVLIPEQGVKLRGVAPLLPYSKVDIRRVQMLGTGRWNDPTVWREPTLIGGIFAAPDPMNFEQFTTRFERIYQTKPSRLAALGYDAGAMAAALASIEGANGFSALTSRDGFNGVNGLFRFRSDGRVERSLSILEITPREGAVAVELGAETFDPPTG